MTLPDQGQTEVRRLTTSLTNVVNQVNVNITKPNVKVNIG